MEESAGNVAVGKKRERAACRGGVTLVTEKENKEMRQRK